MSIASLSCWEVNYVRIYRTSWSASFHFRCLKVCFSTLQKILWNVSLLTFCHFTEAALKATTSIPSKGSSPRPSHGSSITNIHASHNKKPHGTWLPSRGIASTESPEIRSLPRSHWEWCPLVMTEEGRKEVEHSLVFLKIHHPSIPHPTWEKLL